MDNQQERLVDRSFLAGLIVGEGTFCLAVRRNGKRCRIMPQFSMQMNDGETIEIVGRSLKAIGLSANIYHRPERKCWTVQAAGFLRVKRYLEELLPHLTGAKREAAEIVSAFIASREKANKFDPYSDEEIALVERLRSVNGIPARGRTPIEDLRGEETSRQWKARRRESSETNTLGATL